MKKEKLMNKISDAFLDITSSMKELRDLDIGNYKMWVSSIVTYADNLEEGVDLDAEDAQGHIAIPEESLMRIYSLSPLELAGLISFLNKLLKGRCDSIALGNTLFQINKTKTVDCVGALMQNLEGAENAPDDKE